MFDKFKKIFISSRYIQKEKSNIQEASSKLHHEKRHETKNKEKKLDKSLTKTGIRRLDPRADLYKLFQTDRKEEEYKKVVKPEIRKHISKTQKNKHGIPILDNKKNYLAVFKENNPETPQEKNTPVFKKKNSDAADEIEINFEEIINERFNGKTTEELLAEKTDQLNFKKTLSLKQKIKRYPYPQARLDLHGYSAIAAERKTESFIKSACMQGTETLLIIVGKGLHSDDGKAILRDVAEDLLNRLIQENVVLAYEWDNKKKIKSGAVIVYLASMNS